jgi:hypothetical protein
VRKLEDRNAGFGNVPPDVEMSGAALLALSR